MTINNQEILRRLESHEPITELRAGIQCRQDLIRKIMDVQNPGKTKDLITIARDFKELMNLDENELNLRYLSKKYPDFELSLKDGDIHAELRSYKGKTLPEFPSGLERLEIYNCENLEALPEFPPGLESLGINNCPNLGSIPEFPPGLKDLTIWKCRNLEAIPEFPPGLERLAINKCHNLTQETLDRIKEFKKK